MDSRTYTDGNASVADAELELYRSPQINGGGVIAEFHDSSFGLGEPDDQRNLDLLSTARASYRWVATSGSLGHQRGSAHSNGKWWNDPCTSFTGWTCYGPYANLERGTYLARWYCSVETHGGGGADVGVDVVGLVGQYRIVNEKLYNVNGTTVDGYAQIAFTLFDKIDKVEVRFRSHRRAKVVIAKELIIVQTNA